MKKRYFSLLAVLLFALLLMYGCGKDNGVEKQTAEELIKQGWAKFESGNFSGASDDFNAAIGLDTSMHDAYLGLGWAELRQSHGGLAENAFLIYLSKESDSEYQAKGGLVLAYLAQDKFQGVITTANAVLSANPAWSFSHDTNFNQLDLAYALVQAYYETADYTQSLAVINQYFDSTFNPGDVNTNQGRDTLAKKIESLYASIS